MKVEPLHCQHIRYLEEAKFKVEGNIKLAASLLSLHDILLQHNVKSTSKS